MTPPIGTIILLAIVGIVILLMLWAVATSFLEKDPEVQANIAQMQDYGDDEF